MVRLARTSPGRSKALWSWALGGAVVGALAALVLFAPARWLAGWVHSATGERVRLADAQGSVWSGSARLVFEGGEGSRQAVVLPGRVNWALRPAWPGLRARVSADCCTTPDIHIGLLATGWGAASLTLDDSRSSWPAAMLTGLGTPWNTVQPQGQLSLTTRGLSAQWVQGRLTLGGSLVLDALGMSSRLSTVSPMGSYRVTVQGAGATTLALETIEGSLQLKGQGQWVGQRLRFEGVASAGADRIDALSNLLNILGRRDGPRAIIKIG